MLFVISQLLVAIEFAEIFRWKGPAALLQAPYDLFVVFSIKAIGLGPSGTIWDDGELWSWRLWQAAEIMAYYGFSYIYVCDAHLTYT